MLVILPLLSDVCANLLRVPPRSVLPDFRRRPAAEVGFSSHLILALPKTPAPVATICMFLFLMTLAPD
jgi:hypothetical protein